MHENQPPPPASFRAVSRRHPHAAVRAWALANGIEVSTSGGLPRFVFELYEAARPEPAGSTARPVAAPPT